MVSENVDQKIATIKSIANSDSASSKSEFNKSV